jgi:hypothetical protein
MGENPSPLGEAFKVDDSLAPQLKLETTDEAKICEQSLWAAAKPERIAMFGMCSRGRTV